MGVCRLKRVQLGRMGAVLVAAALPVVAARVAADVDGRCRAAVTETLVAPPVEDAAVELAVLPRVLPRLWDAADSADSVSCCITARIARGTQVLVDLLRTLPDSAVIVVDSTRTVEGLSPDDADATRVAIRAILRKVPDMAVGFSRTGIRACRRNVVSLLFLIQTAAPDVSVAALACVPRLVGNMGAVPVTDGLVAMFASLGGAPLLGV